MSLRKFNNYDLDGQLPVLSWNPLAMRCTPVTEGCRNCWHVKMADRLALNPSLSREVRAAYMGGAPAATQSFDEDLPAGRVITVQFMGDLWHKEVPQSYRDCILWKIRKQPKSVFLLLTKRPYSVNESIPDNAWLGTSAHDAASIYAASDAMARCGSVAVHLWLSLEPILSKDIEAIGFGLYDFIAYGPETRNGRETSDSSWMNMLAILKHVYTECAFYDKRKDWKVRDWPEAWKTIEGNNK